MNWGGLVALSEALHLRHDDIDYNNLVLKVFGKGQKERLVPFSHDLRARLYRFAKWQGQKQIHSDLIFAGFGGAVWEKRNSTTSLHLLQRTIGLPKFGWHRLRHTFATQYLRSGGEIVRLLWPRFARQCSNNFEGIATIFVDELSRAFSMRVTSTEVDAVASHVGRAL